MGIVKTLIAAGLVGLISEVAAQTIRQKVYDTHNGVPPANTIINCWVNNGSSGIQKDTIAFNNGVWWVAAGNFTPPPVAGDTIKSVDTLNYGGVIYTGHMRRIYDDANLTLPTGFLDDPNKNVIALSVGANKVMNRSSRPQYTMNAKGWLQKNPNQKIQFINYQLRYVGQDSLKIDTTDIYTQLYFNLEKQDSTWQQGNVFTTMIYQIKGDTMWYQFFNQIIDTTRYGRASIVDSLRYTADSMVIGVVEKNKLENLVKNKGKFIVSPNPTKGDIILNQEGDYYLYNVLGQEVLKGKGNKIDLNRLSLPNGAYFLFLKPENNELLKPEKVIYLK